MTVDAALERLRAGDTAAARQALCQKGSTDDPRCHAALGMLHLATGDSAAAVATLRAAVAIGDRRPGTWLNLALAEEATGDRSRARELMRGIAGNQPGWDEPWLRLAESHRRSGDLAEAAVMYGYALAANPRRREALVGQAALSMRTGRPVDAQMLLLQACGDNPGSAEVWDALGISLMMTRDARAAEGAFASAQALAPADTAIAIRRAEAAIEAGSGTAELARLEAACSLDPLDVPSLAARGVVLGRLGQREGAAEVLEVAAALAPDCAATIQALASAYMQANHLSLAAATLQQAVALVPDDPGLQNNLAATLIRLHRYHQAQEILEQLLVADGETPGVLCNLTNVRVALGCQAEGLSAAQRAVALAPHSGIAWRAMGNALAYHPDVTPAALLATQRRIGETLVRTAPMPLPHDRDPDRRLRIGLLSASLRTHPVGWLTIAAFEALDPSAFDVVCFGQAASADAIQRRFATIASAWHEVDGLAHATTADHIRAASIDVLIDLGGYGDLGMLPVCAHRAAPVQVKWVGAQAHSTGLAEMDWFISDRWETPPELAAHYSERLLLMQDGYVCYSPPAYAPDVAPLPALASNQVTFGCFNNLAKITPVVIATWARILQRVPHARLVLKSHQCGDAATAARLQARFTAHGIAAERIEMRGSAPHRDLLKEYGDIDIVLDPFPYTGGLTTCEALWMGVPTVCLAGEIFAARHSTSHMSNVGLADWVANDVAGYEALAAAKAADILALAAIREGLRARVRESPLCDAPRFGAQFGSALRHIWQDWCART